MDRKSLVAALLVVALVMSNVLWLTIYQGSRPDGTKSQDTDAKIASLNDQITQLKAQEASLTSVYQALQSEYDKLSAINSTLRESYDLLAAEYNKLRSNQSLVYSLLVDLEESYTQLRNEKSDLEVRYDQLSEQYKTLQVQYQNLLASCGAAEKQLHYLNMVRLDSLDLDYYMTLRENYVNFGDIQSNVDFCAHLSMHDRANYPWAPEDSTFHGLTGQHRYDEAKSTELEVLNLIGVTNVDSDAVKVAKILSFIHGNVTYQYDMYDRYYAPTETLSSGTGDCEDFSILASSLFEIVGVQSAIGFFHNGTDGHAMVLVNLDDLGGQGFYKYDDLTSYGLSSGRWIIIEPQALIDGQADKTWFPRWHLDVAAET